MSAVAETLAALRTAVARIADDVPGRGQAPARIALGVGEVDAVLGGGLKRGALHAVTASGPAGMAAATGFAAALAGLAAGKGRTVLWIRQDMAALEAGEPWGPGLLEVGLDPASVLVLRVRDLGAALKAAEAGLSCQALAATVIEPFGALMGFDRVAGRRLALAAGRSGALALMLRTAVQPGFPAGLCAAETRWRIAPLASSVEEAWGTPLVVAELVRNRLGALGRWSLAWVGDDPVFRLVERRLERPAASARQVSAASGATDLGARAAGTADRPTATAGQGAKPFRRAG